MTENQNIISERAAAIIIKDDDILLMHRRKHGREYFAVPGGQVEKGETPQIAAQREVKEETNLDVEIGEMLLSFERDIYEENGIAEYHEKSGGRVKEYFFLAKSIFGETKLGGPELERQNEENFHELQWVKLCEIKNIPLLPERVKKLLIGN